MAAEVKYHSGPRIQVERGPLCGEAVMWVQVGQGQTFRPVRLTTKQIIQLALQCLQVLDRRGKE